MSKVWFRNLGFYSNPFSIKPAAFHDRVFGYDKVVDDISYAILNNKVIVVQGEYGSGKSTILRRLINDFGGKKQVIYYSCNRIGERLNVKALLNGRYGFWGKLFDMKPKNMVLLLDEAQELGAKDYEKLYSYYQEGYFRSIILVGQDIKKENIPKEFSEKLEEVSVGSIDAETAVKVIRKRIGNLSLLSDNTIRELFEKSGNNVRLLLKVCEEACKLALAQNKPAVDSAIVNAVIGVEEEHSKAEPNKMPAKATKEEVKEEPKERKKPVVKKVAKKVKKKVVTKKKSKIYDPERYKDMINTSAEELLNKGTDEIFSDEQYY